MNALPLQLRHAAMPVREAAAWFIAGADVSHWISEICRWAIPQENLRLYVLPRAPGERGAAGVLVVPPVGVRPGSAPRALGFGVVAGRLYLPVDAQLWPPVEPHELKLAYDVQVFHPGIGLVGFEPKDALKVADVLRQPPFRLENWNFARPGVEVNQRLYSVQLLEPISIEEIFGDAPEEIGTEPVQELPPAPNEPWSSPVGEWANEAGRRLARALHSLLQRLPHTGTRRTWVNDLEDWAAGKFQGLARNLEAMRNKEIHRLLHQLEHDPERGLRHAIPMNQLAHRGLAPPGARLGTRLPNFNLNLLRGGQAADFWHLAPELQGQLRDKYRELANRELQLGRFRRAAYIFAQLLGDLESAVSALKQGRHFREAAVVYKEHLRRPREAAVCLAEGGLFSEAIGIYEQESLFLEAGDLYSRLGQLDQAKAAYELEAHKRVTAGDRVGGAKLLEEKLGAPERALVMLSEGWPQSSQAGGCLAAGFELLARKSWHSRAASLLERLREEKTRADLLPALARVLTTQAAEYPDRAIRHGATDLVRIKASQRLDNAASAAEAAILTDALTKLAPEDRLLARDALRFNALRSQRLRSNRQNVTVRKTNGPILVRTFDLPKGIAWHTVKSCGAYFFAAGYGGKKLCLLRGDWEGIYQSVLWPSPPLVSNPLLLEVDEETSRPARVLITPGPSRPLIRLRELAFRATDRFAGVVPAGTPDWLPDDLVAGCTRGNMVWLLRDAGDSLSECRLLDGQLVSSLGLRGAFAEDPGAVACGSLLVQRDFLWLAAKRRLFMFRQGKTLGGWQAETEIASLIPSAPNLPLCVLARLARGVSLHWADNLKENTETLCDELVNPFAAFTADGTLIVVGGNEGRICNVSQQGAQQITAFTLVRSTPIAVVRAEGANQFAVFCADGKVQLFRLAG